MSRYLLVDVGGSRWRAAYIADDQRTRLSHEGPPPIRAGRLDPTRLRQGLEGLASDSTASITPEAVVVASTGVARLDGDIDAMHQALRFAPSTTTTMLVSDAVAGLAGALGWLGAGSLLSVGTGVAAVERNAGGEWKFGDGWGPLLGDEGGGYWLGSQGLRAALRAIDGRPNGSESLANLARIRFGPDPAKWPLRGDLENVVAAIAGFATNVIDSAELDEVANQIVEAAVDHLVSTASVFTSTEVRVGGGVLESDRFRHRLVSRSARFLPALGDPLAGLELVVANGVSTFADWAGLLASSRHH